jgi:hypothetical protein
VVKIIVFLVVARIIIVNEYELIASQLKLKLFAEEFGVLLIDHAFIHLMTYLSSPFTRFAMTKLSEDKQSVSKKLLSKYVAEQLYGVLKAFTPS